MGAALKREGQYTYADYLQWPDDERWELIDGVAFCMTPAPTTRHQGIVGELFFQLQQQLRGQPCAVFVAPFDVRLAKREHKSHQVGTVVQPDISIVCDRNKLDDAGCVGAPDVVIEVLSPSTSRKDQLKKRDAYERAGVREYQIVDANDRLLTRYTLAEGKFAGAEIVDLAGRVELHALVGTWLDFDALRDVAFFDVREPDMPAYN